MAIEQENKVKVITFLGMYCIRPDPLCASVRVWLRETTVGTGESDGGRSFGERGGTAAVSQSRWTWMGAGEESETAAVTHNRHLVEAPG